MLLDTLAVYVLVFGLLPRLLKPRQRGPALLGLLVFLASSAVFYHGGYALLFAKPLHWTPLNLLNGLLRHTISYGLLAVLLMGKRYFEAQQHVVQLQKVQAESELRNLKAQLDPHFLFNNLNVLRGLIQQDPAAASEYLDKLAALYRFLIRHQPEDVVPLADEMQFAEQYIYLLRCRFGAAYTFQQQLPAASQTSTALLVPGTLQLLLENAVKHNAGDEHQPLTIYLDVTDTSLTVRHARRPKLTPVDSAGTGLANLRERYWLLFGQQIRVEATAATFAVTVPLLRAANRPQPLAFAPLLATRA